MNRGDPEKEEKQRGSKPATQTQHISLSTDTRGEVIKLNTMRWIYLNSRVPLCVGCRSLRSSKTTIELVLHFVKHAHIPHMILLVLGCVCSVSIHSVELIVELVLSQSMFMLRQGGRKMKITWMKDNQDNKS